MQLQWIHAAQANKGRPKARWQLLSTSILRLCARAQQACWLLSWFNNSQQLSTTETLLMPLPASRRGRRIGKNVKPMGWDEDSLITEITWNITLINNNEKGDKNTERIKSKKGKWCTKQLFTSRWLMCSLSLSSNWLFTAYKLPQFMYWAWCSVVRNFPRACCVEQGNPWLLDVLTSTGMLSLSCGVPGHLALHMIKQGTWKQRACWVESLLGYPTKGLGCSGWEIFASHCVLQPETLARVGHPDESFLQIGGHFSSFLSWEALGVCHQS